ncbi:11516_t:CDS:2, partial [Scutellospora calospora]
EILLSFDFSSNIIVDNCSIHTVSIRTSGHEKSNFTLVLTCLADGTKLPSIIIFKLMNVPRQPFFARIISNSRDDKEDYLIFDYDKLGQCTNSRNYIYIQNKFENYGESSVTSISKSSNKSISKSLSASISKSSSASIDESSSININESLDLYTSESSNTIISEDSDTNIKANFIHEYEADFNNNNKVAPKAQ